MPTPHDILKRYFGYDSFRPNQEQIVEAILDGRDVLAIMPTGAGKSICYQVPAIALGGWTLVVSPLISLMKDQVNALEQAGITAGFVNSTLSVPAQLQVLDAVAAGMVRLLYVAPERLGAPEFTKLCDEHPPALVAVDEAHCISRWGQDFRPSYMGIAGFVDSLPVRPVVAAFTATATQRVRVDIADALDLRNPLQVVASFDRPNLHFEVRRPQGTRGKDSMLRAICRKREGQSGIVYCTSRKSVELVCDMLNEEGFSATRYHAGLSAGERKANQDDFVFDRKRIMVATNAFGMGVDKSNVSFIVHYNLPLDVESYYQEAGRAGRDGEPADCILLYAPKDVRTCEFLLTNGIEEAPGIDGPTRRELIDRAMDRLKLMTFYATTTDCLRGYLLKYFDEAAPGYCGHCGNCETKFEEQDITVEAQKIISCVYRLAQRNRIAGRAMIVDILRGSKNTKVLDNGYDTLSTYGIMADVSTRRIRFIMDALVERGLLLVDSGKYPTLRFTPQAGEFLRNRERLVVKVPKETEREKREREFARAGQPDAQTAAETLADLPVDEELFQRLKELRARLAAEAGIPAYIVFHDRTLRVMSQRKPQTEAELLDIPGVGEKKAAQYGDAFLRAIKG
ncbi:MAG: DNA helicase RecQ [Coriobacteriaceae bacterium]|nr:DNA helicase RecQ [Coriobacteriaceae bacterium]